jgi:hypothetical protein
MDHLLALTNRRPVKLDLAIYNYVRREGSGSESLPRRMEDVIEKRGIVMSM